MEQGEYAVTWRLWRREAFLEQFRGRELSINIYLTGLTLFFLFVLRGGRYRLFIWLLIAACLYLLLFRWLVRARRTYKLRASLCGGLDWERSVLFRVTSFVVLEGRATEEIRYGFVTKLQENPTETRIYYASHVLILPRAALSEDDYEKVTAKIREQMNKKA